MKIQIARQTFSVACLLLVSATITGCWHVKPDPLSCGNGTIEKYVDSQRICVLAPLSCGNGTQEQATGGERECVPSDVDGRVHCREGTFELEQATGGERECVGGTTICNEDEVEYAKDDGTRACRPNVTCGDGTYEQATGGERECVPNNTAVKCGAGTYEQATGGEREQTEGGESEQATGGERECQPTNPKT